MGDGNNHYRVETAWPDHEPSQPWAVYLASGQIYRSLVFDFDEGPTYAPHVDAREAFWYLEVCGFAPVLAESGGGGYHVLARLSVPTHAHVIGPIVSNLHNFWPSLDISPMVNPRTGCIRPPGSLHRSGHRSRVIAGSLTAFTSTPAKDALDRLESLTQSSPSATPATVATQSKPISDKAYRLLRYGDTEQAFPSRSEMIQAIAYSYVRAGKSVTALFRALRDKANLGGVKVQRMPLKRAEQYVERSYFKAVSFEPTRTAPAQTMREIGALRQTFDHADWSGLAGATDRTVADVLLAMAERLGTMTFGMSMRELAERAAIDKETARRSQQRLVEAGFMNQVAPAVGPNAAIWELRLADAQIHSQGGGRILSGGNLQDDLPEAFRWQTGLGHNAYRSAQPEGDRRSSRSPYDNRVTQSPQSSEQGHGDS